MQDVSGEFCPVPLEQQPVQEYEQLKTHFKNGPFSEAQVLAKLNAWEMQIRDATMEADQAHQDAISVAVWESSLGSLKAQLKYAREH